MENKEIIANLNLCAAQCDHCYYACDREKDRDNLKRCMMLDKDCADICRLSAQLLERNSENVDLFLKLCSEICLKCSEECEKHAHMEHCKKCSEACRKCAEVCFMHYPEHK